MAPPVCSAKPAREPLTLERSRGEWRGAAVSQRCQVVSRGCFSCLPKETERSRGTSGCDWEPRWAHASRWAVEEPARSPGVRGGCRYQPPPEPLPPPGNGVTGLGAGETNSGNVAGRPPAPVTEGGRGVGDEQRAPRRGYLVLEAHLSRGTVGRETVEARRGEACWRTSAGSHHAS